MGGLSYRAPDSSDRLGNDPRAFFMWRLPASAGADVLSEAEIESLRALPEESMIDLLERVSTAADELESLRRQMATRWVVVHPCPVCGSEVIGRTDKIYCRSRCRQKAYVERLNEGEDRHAD